MSNEPAKILHKQDRTSKGTISPVAYRAIPKNPLQSLGQPSLRKPCIHGNFNAVALAQGSAALTAGAELFMLKKA